ncbi:uncharacterized protein LOC143250411 isoform X2 [Tachypleus tridentatus]|uniref:uncharacterized protein LOC143250411 isoform X2 n=1 Tax=Tachypleus tridentatus TaxID=6853 RepID=UPI003FCF341A
MIPTDTLVKLFQNIRRAARVGHVERDRDLMLRAKTDTDTEGRTVLHLAAANGCTSTVKTLLQYGAKVNAVDQSGYSPLHQAAKEGHLEIVNLLLKNGSHVDTQEKAHGNTSLHEASRKGYSQTVEAICNHKAKTHIKNKEGSTALHMACQNGHNQTCRVLLTVGCNPDVKNNNGDTPLHTSARSGHAGVIRILISAYCDVNQVNTNGDTALHVAVAMGKRKLTKILLEAGVDQSIQNKQGDISLDLANRKEFSDIAEFLSNPPPRNGKKRENKSMKRRGKGSETSQGSKDSGCRQKKEKKKSKRGYNVRFHDEKGQSTSGLWCPYGFHTFSSLSSFPILKMRSEPTQKEKQYFVNLSGNNNKVPVGAGYTCYCAPFFYHVEKKLESDKQELIEHIETAHDNLNSKIIHLEQSTRSHLFKFSQSIKEKVANERIECMERMERRTFADRLELKKQRLGQLSNIRADLQSWVESKKNEFKDKSGFSTDQSSVTNTCIRQPAIQHWSQSVTKRKNITNITGLMRSKSEELVLGGDGKTDLSEATNVYSPEWHNTAFRKTCPTRYPVPVKDRDLSNHYPMRMKARSYQAPGVVQRLQTDFEKLGARPKSDYIPQSIQQRDLAAFGNERKYPRDSSYINVSNTKGQTDQLAYIESSCNYRYSSVSNLGPQHKELTNISEHSGGQSGAPYLPSSSYRHLDPTSQVEYNKPVTRRADIHNFQTLNNYDNYKYIPDYYSRYVSSVRPVNYARRGIEMKNQIMRESLNGSSVV